MDGLLFKTFQRFSIKRKMEPESSQGLYAQCVGFCGEQAQRSALLQAAVSWYGVDIRQITAQAPVLTNCDAWRTS